MAKTPKETTLKMRARKRSKQTMFYQPVQTERYFEKGRRYSEIDWSNLVEVIDAFDRRIRGWYIEPAESLAGQSGHSSFTVMAMTCLLIDALSQYRYGELASDGCHFKRFVRDCLPSYKGSLPSSIWHYDNKFSPNGKELKDYAEVLWNGFRCGILHEAHAPLYCGINPGSSNPQFEATNHATYAPSTAESRVGSDCPTVIIYPEHLFSEVKGFFGDYLRDLKDKDPKHNTLRTDFKRKFSASFGVDLSSSSLP